MGFLTFLNTSWVFLIFIFNLKTDISWDWLSFVFLLTNPY